MITVKELLGENDTNDNVVIFVDDKKVDCDDVSKYNDCIVKEWFFCPLDCSLNISIESTEEQKKSVESTEEQEKSVEKTVTITLNELIRAQAKAMVKMTMKNLLFSVITEDIAELNALTCHELFNEEDK